MERWWPERRVLAVLAGLVMLAIGAYAGLFAVLLVAMSAHRPDPDAYDGDPCCDHPDTWTDTLGGTATGIGAGLVAAVILGGGMRLLWSAAIGRTPQPFEHESFVRRAALLVALGLLPLAAIWVGL